MAASESSTSISPTNFLPKNRKHCELCDKTVYLHQPLLFCSQCNKVFHGKCLRLKKSLVYILQQLEWFCLSCSSHNNITCNTCSFPILVTDELLDLCKNCCKSVQSQMP